MPTLKSVSALVFCLMASLPSYALTNVSAVATYSANDKYIVQADITCSSTTVACLHFTGISSASGGGIDIDLNGHNVVSTAYHALDIDTSVGSIYLHDSVGTGSFKGKVGYGGSGPFVVPAIFIQNSATDPSARILIAGIRAYGEIRVQSTDKTAFPMKAFHSEYNHIFNGGWTLLKLSNPYQTGEYVDNRYDSTIVVQGGLAAFDCDSPRIDYSIVVGGPGSNIYSTTLNTDDGVLFSCSTGTCTGGTMDHLTVYDVFDGGWEGSGHLNAAHITNNTAYRPVVAGMVGYGPLNFSLSASEIANNTVKAPSNPIRLLYMYGGASDASSFFSTNTIIGNSIDTSLSSWMGGNFVASSGNVVTNNKFGSAAVVLFQSSTAVTDGGGNQCASTTPSGGFFTCH